MADVLLVEDELSLRLSLRASLRAAGHAVRAVPSAEEAREAAAQRSPDVAIVDWNLPGESGLALVEEWRRQGGETRIIMLSARDSIEHRVEGLEAGAHDYVTKPFSVDELLARVAVQLRDRPTAPRAPRLLAIGDHVTVDVWNRTLERGGETIRLTTQESQALAYLAARPRRVVTRTDLLRDVWGFRNPNVQTRAVDNTIYRLRAKIERDPASPNHLTSVHGEGYRFEP